MLPAQRKQAAAEGEARPRLATLGGHVRPRPERKPRLDAGLGEAETRLVRPAHGRPGTVPPGHVPLSLFGHVLLLEAELVAVVEEGRSAQKEQSQKRAACLRLVPVAPAGGETDHVVVRQRPNRPAAFGDRRLRALDDVAQRGRVERGVDEREVERELELVPLPVVRGHHDRVEHVRLADQHAGGFVLLADLPPAAVDVVHLGAVHAVDGLEAVRVLRIGRLVAQLAVVDEPVSDVDPEAGDPAVEPEAQDVVERVADARVPPVEVRLLGQEVVHVPLARLFVEGPGGTAKDAAPVVRRVVAAAVRPDVPVAVLGRAGRARVMEPVVLVARVVGDDVEEDPNPPPPRLRNQLIEDVEVAELAMDVAVVGDVIAPVGVRRGHDRVQPDAVDAEPLEVVEPVDDAGEIADAVTVRVEKRPRIDLIDRAALPPRRHFGAGPVELLTRRLGRKYEFGSDLGSSISTRRESTAVLAMSPIGCSIVVSGGFVQAAASMPSKPTTERFSGTDRPASAAAWRMPIAIRSFEQMIPVVRPGSLRSFRQTQKPPSTVNSSWARSPSRAIPDDSSAPSHPTAFSRAGR